MVRYKGTELKCLNWSHEEWLAIKGQYCGWYIFCFTTTSEHSLFFFFFFFFFFFARLHTRVSCTSDCQCRGHKFGSQLGHITFMAVSHEIISTVILCH